jgi:GntR family transcriptional regulator
MRGSSFVISQTDPAPMYQQLMDQICRRVAAGDWPAGYELPSIRVLAARSRVSVITVKRAYLELERQGVIVTRPGRGSFIAAGADLGLRLRRQELEEHLKAVAGLSLLLSVPVEELAQRLQELRAAALEASPQVADAGGAGKPRVPGEDGQQVAQGEDEQNGNRRTQRVRETER